MVNAVLMIGAMLRMSQKSNLICFLAVLFLTFGLRGLIAESSSINSSTDAGFELDSTGDSLIGDGTDIDDTTGERTSVEDAGSADDADDLRDLNIANTVTVTYDNGNGELAGPVRILLTLTAISLAPTLLLLLTSFTRILIVLHFTRNALNLQTAPPNQVMIGLALFLTFFIMNPIITQVYNEAILPLDRGELTQREAFDKGIAPLREFMYRQTQTKDASMFMEIARLEWDNTVESIPTYVLVPAFVISELRTAFIIGFIIYIPFIVIDMVVASVLMSMGMMMLPPTTISMPFKVLLFVLADGWNLVIMNLVRTFY